MFSQTVEYALRSMVVLAMNPDSPRTAHQIADSSRMPVDYLFKVLQALGRAGLVNAQRGKHGGFTLARHAAMITILDVVNAVDPIKRIHICPLGIASHGTRLCPVHRKLDSAMCQVEDAFREATLAAMVDVPLEIRPLCGQLVQAHA